MVRYIVTLPVLLFATFAAGHPHGEDHGRRMSEDEIQARQVAGVKRHVAVRSCAPQIAEYNRERKMKRGTPVEKRAISAVTNAPGITATAGSQWQPAFSSLQNNTCVTAPEVTEGPYYTNGEYFRQDVRDGQPGVFVLLDIGLIDVTTCKPLPKAVVEIWHTNSTGFYAGYTGSSLGTGGGGGGPPSSNSTASGSGASSSGSAMPTGSGVPSSGGAMPTGSGVPSSGGAMPTGGGPSGGGGGTGGGHAATTDNNTFLRGLWPTNSNGLVEFKTIFPGFYTGRTIHIHTMVHTNYTIQANGTLTMGVGSVSHIGQIFFEDSLADQIVATSPYSANTNSRTKNAADSIMAQENADGNNAITETVMLGSDLSAGLLGYITIGVDPSAKHSIDSNQYLTSPLTTFSPIIPTFATAAVATGGSTVGTTGAASTTRSRSIFGWLQASALMLLPALLF